MLEAVTGAASVAVVVLAWLLLVEAMAAAIVVLATFTVIQWRSLRALVVESSGPVGSPPAVPVPVPSAATTVPSGTADDQGDGEAPRVRIGGGVMRWH